jgi:hypothetical protein
MMIFLPPVMKVLRSPECSAWPSMDRTCTNGLVLLRNCVSGFETLKVRKLLLACRHRIDICRVAYNNC